jgi:hypothetical protein
MPIYGGLNPLDIDLDSYVSSTVLFLSTDSEHTLDSLDVSEYEHYELATHYSPTSSIPDRLCFFSGYPEATNCVPEE